MWVALHSLPEAPISLPFPAFSFVHVLWLLTPFLHHQSYWVLFTFPSLWFSLLIPFSIFKDLCSDIGSTQIIQRKLPIWKSADIIPPTTLISLCLWTWHIHKFWGWGAGVWGRPSINSACYQFFKRTVQLDLLLSLRTGYGWKHGLWSQGRWASDFGFASFWWISPLVMGPRMVPSL